MLKPLTLCNTSSGRVDVLRDKEYMEHVKDNDDCGLTDIFEQKLRHKVVSSDIFSWHCRVRFDVVHDEVLHSATLVVVRRHVRVGLAGAVLHRRRAELYTIGGLSYRENSSL